MTILINIITISSILDRDFEQNDRGLGPATPIHWAIWPGWPGGGVQTQATAVIGFVTGSDGHQATRTLLSRACRTGAEPHIAGSDLRPFERLLMQSINFNRTNELGIRFIAGIVLCGGQSKRMGKPKAWLPFGGELMLPRVVRILRTVVAPVVVVAAPDQDLPPLP